MNQILTTVTKKCNAFSKCIAFSCTRRSISALYITGDKAKENYVTLLPYMDFKQRFENLEDLQYTIEKRKMQINIKDILKLYEIYKDKLKLIEQVEDEREMVVKQIKELSKQTSSTDNDLLAKLKEQGKSLKNDFKSLKNEFYPIEDEFCHAFLQLPNSLHHLCPVGEHGRFLYSSQQERKLQGPNHMDAEHLIHYIEPSRYYMLNEAAEFDIFATQALVRYFVQKGKFIQTANPDFVRCVLLEANATPLENYHKVMEENLQNQLNVAYLCGGGSFESFLASVTKLCVYPSVLPLKYVCMGRLYEKSAVSDKEQPSLYTATQTNAVQTFVATHNADETEEIMDSILNLAVDFFKTFTNLHFRVVYVNAEHLLASESLRAQIEIYSPSLKRYVCVGRVSNYRDFVSKRMLFTMREQKNYRFLHLVGGPVLYTTRLIAALIEHGEDLDYQKIAAGLNVKSNSAQSQTKNATEDFKSLFK